MQLRSLYATIGAVALGFGAFAACGGSTSSGITTTDGGGAEDGAAKPYTLDDVCDRTGPLVCALRKGCCEAGGGYDEAGCLAHDRTECQADVAAARAGTETFHPERIDDCLAKYREIFATSCTLTYDLLQKYAPVIATCNAFEGQLPVGAPCERAAQCKPGGVNEIVGCDDTTKTCQLTTILDEGKPCSIGGDVPNLCGDGLYCDVASFATKPFTGVCKKKTSLGVSCDATKKPVNLECGLGNYCDPGTRVCTAGKGAGAACTEDLECASVSCVMGDAGAGACKAPNALAKPEECKGP